MQGQSWRKRMIDDRLWRKNCGDEGRATALHPYSIHTYIYISLPPTPTPGAKRTCEMSQGLPLQGLIQHRQNSVASLDQRDPREPEELWVIPPPLHLDEIPQLGGELHTCRQTQAVPMQRRALFSLHMFGLQSTYDIRVATCILTYDTRPRAQPMSHLWVQRQQSQSSAHFAFPLHLDLGRWLSRSSS